MGSAPANSALTNWLTSQGISFTENANLSEVTTFQLGGPCPVLIHCSNPIEVSSVLRYLSDIGSERLFIGGGSNLVISDAGLPYPVVQYTSDEPHINVDGDRLTVSGATQLDALAEFSVSHGLAGLVNCSGIPGTVGGAVAGNAGAFGWQVGDAIIDARLCSSRGETAVVSPADLEFAYRHSRLKDSDDVLLDVTFELSFGDKAELRAKREEILELRRSKHPDWKVDHCAGSVFRNIEATSKAERRQAAGYFLEESGAKSMSVGGAGLFPRHANIIIKKDDSCTAQDVYDLHLMMKTAVKAKFGLDLVPEIRFIGSFGSGRLQIDG